MKSAAHIRPSYIFDALRAQELFLTVSDATLSAWVLRSVIRNHARGDFLFMPDARNTHLHIVLNGKIKIFRETRDGQEAVIHILGTGDVCGEAGLLPGFQLPYGAEAIEISKTLSIPLEDIQAKIYQDSALAMSILRLATQQKLKLEITLEHATIQSAVQRIGCFLLEHASPPASFNERSAVTVFPYDKSIIAQKLGMRPETFSRALAHLENEAGVAVSGVTATIADINLLSEKVCGACSSNYPCNTNKKIPKSVY